jgi:dolichol-phosphate mannosyltransferase
MKVTVVVPTYNEADNVTPMTQALWGLEVDGLDVLIVDDESPDGTGDIADRIVLDNPERLHVLHRTGPRGLGVAYLDGFRWALGHGADIVVQMDCDFSHSPSDVPRLLKCIPEYDVVVGSRYVEGGKTDEDWGVGRVLLSWWANNYARIILGSSLQDVTAGFKVWSRKVLETIDLDSIRSQGYVFQVEMAFVSERLGFRILELPIYFEDRRIGESKMTLPVQLEAALRVWEVRWRHRRLRSAPRS